ncbi:MAG: hypothetical protein WBR35_19935, partial [Anaerolineae bacterium]
MKSYWRGVTWASRVMIVVALLLAGRLAGAVNAGRPAESGSTTAGAAAMHPWLGPTAGAWDAGFQFPGVDGDVSALVQDANGNIYLGGHFTHVGSQPISNVAKWNSATATWSAVGSIGGVRDLALAANGHLYAVGDMLGFAAMWNGSVWTILGAGLWGTAYTVAIDPASGDVYVGGCFLTDGTGAVTLNNLARWDGSTLSAVGNGANGCVYALAIDPVTSVLYVGGDFTTPGDRVAKWSGFSWGPLGAGFNGSVRSLLWQGNTLYAGGAFTTNGWNTVTLNYVARWNGTAWGALGVGFNSWVYSLTADAGGNVYAGGIFTQDSTNSVTFNRIAKWNGAAWSALGSGASEAIRDLLVQNGDLYAGGFSGRGIFHRWRSGSWTDLTPSQGNGVEAAVQAMLLDGSGNLFVGGRFFNAGLQTVRHIAKWNGSAWSPLGSGLSDAVYALARDGAGNLYAGFGSASQGYVAKWNGSAWSYLGNGLNGQINALAVDGSNNVYVAGAFGSPGGGGPLEIARWNGSAWVSVGGGLYGQSGVRALAVDSSGNLYAGGDFLVDGTFTTPLSNIARWNGTAWSSVGAGLNAPVNALQLGSNGVLYAGGQFTAEAGGGTGLDHVAAWNGSTWAPLGSGTNDAVTALALD